LARRGPAPPTPNPPSGTTADVKSRPTEPPPPPRRDVAGLCASLPTLPPRMAATMAENPRLSWDGGEIRRETDCLLEGTGFEISVPRYPRWSCGSPRCAIRAEETRRKPVRHRQTKGAATDMFCLLPPPR